MTASPNDSIPNDSIPNGSIPMQLARLTFADDNGLVLSFRRSQKEE